jgi:pyruvate formate lyase activating enzyme
LYTRNYARVSSYGLDPIEKKPLYHFYPGSSIFSLGTTGCNFSCQFCQNWSIAQAEPSTVNVSPQQAVSIAKEAKSSQNCIGLAYTYSEPLVWYEYVLDTAEKAQQAGLKNVLVTNGFVQEKPFLELLPFIDAMNIDVKAFTADFYQQWCKGDLKPVLDTVERANQHCHVELTTLLIPGLNDSEEEIEKLVNWIAGVNPNIPLHLSRYFPNYRMDLPPTPVETMEKAFNLAKERLKFVYLGNLAGTEAVNTYCPKCKQILVERHGYQVEAVGLAGGKCANCNEKAYIIND